MRIKHSASERRQRGRTTPARCSRRLSRRQFGQAVAAAASFVLVPSHVVAGRGGTPPSEKLNLACVGLGAAGLENLRACETENIVALCDVDWQLASYAFSRYPQAKRYKDFREMLDAQPDMDAVIVATPDHTHAVVTAAAMKKGKHVYTQMPLAHDIGEVRRLVQLAKQTGVATQMGNEGYSEPTVRRVCEWIWDGAIGEVREVHCWTHWPVWPQGLRRPKDRPPKPDQLDWDLWLGPAPARPYHPAYHPYRWRAWFDFGTGALGAIGTHVLAGAYWALRLAEAKTVTVEADVEGVTDESYPRASTIHYHFPKRGDQPPVTLHWYDGGRRPPRPKEWPASREFVGSGGTIFVGTKGKLVYGAVTAGTHPGQAGPRLLPESLMRSYRPPKPSLPRVPDSREFVVLRRHEQEWLRACKGGPAACSRFEVAGPLTELVLLGNLAVRAGRPIEWDAESTTVRNAPELNDLVHRPYRVGWSL